MIMPIGAGLCFPERRRVWRDQDHESDGEGGVQEHNDFTSVVVHTWSLIHYYGREKYGTDNVKLHGLKRLRPWLTLHGPQSNTEHSSL